MADNFLASATSFCLVIVFLCCYAFKNTELTGLSDIQERMSLEQRDLYIINTQGLSLLVVGSVIGTLIVSALIFAVQLSFEAVRFQRERQASLARRLRYAGGDEAVDPPSLAVDGYHLFLSHTVSGLSCESVETIVCLGVPLWLPRQHALS